jgi:hypothetical protein
MTGSSNVGDGQGGGSGSSHLAPETLAAYALDSSSLDADALDHLRSCAVCQDGAAWTRNLVRGLDTLPACPPVESIMAYALGELSGSGIERIEVSAHIAWCAACADEAAVARETLMSTQPAAPSFLPIQRIPAITGTSLPAASQRGAGGSSGEDSGQRYVPQQARDLEITLYWEVKGSAYILTGIVTPLTADAATQLAGSDGVAILYASTSDAGKPDVRHYVDDAPVSDGAFELRGVPAGVYHLEALLGPRLIEIGPIVLP